jgi:hypothetical protein
VSAGARRASRARYLPIAEHGLIGDLHTVALVGTDGTIDWYCCPRFDSPSVFAAILDADHGGLFRISPDSDGWSSKQLYLPDTNILITRFLMPEGVAEVQDFMPPPRADNRASLNPPNLAVKQTLVNRIGRSMPSVPLLGPLAGCPPARPWVGSSASRPGATHRPSPRQDRHESAGVTRHADLRRIGGRIHSHTNGPPNPDRFLFALDRACRWATLPVGPDQPEVATTPRPSPS